VYTTILYGYSDKYNVKYFLILILAIKCSSKIMYHYSITAISFEIPNWHQDLNTKRMFRNTYVLGY